MTVRRLRAKQRGPRCSYCEERAVHRGCYFRMFACSEHLDKLTEDDAAQAAQDSYQTEGERQAMRFY